MKKYAFLMLAIIPLTGCVVYQPPIGGEYGFTYDTSVPVASTAPGIRTYSRPVPTVSAYEDVPEPPRVPPVYSEIPEPLPNRPVVTRQTTILTPGATIREPAGSANPSPVVQQVPVPQAQTAVPASPGVVVFGDSVPSVVVTNEADNFTANVTNNVSVTNRLSLTNRLGITNSNSLVSGTTNVSGTNASGTNVSGTNITGLQTNAINEAAGAQAATGVNVTNGVGFSTVTGTTNTSTNTSGGANSPQNRPAGTSTNAVRSAPFTPVQPPQNQTTTQPQTPFTPPQGFTPGAPPTQPTAPGIAPARPTTSPQTPSPGAPTPTPR